MTPHEIGLVCLIFLVGVIAIVIVLTHQPSPDRPDLSPRTERQILRIRNKHALIRAKRTP